MGEGKRGNRNSVVFAGFQKADLRPLLHDELQPPPTGGQVGQVPLRIERQIGLIRLLEGFQPLPIGATNPPPQRAVA